MILPNFQPYKGIHCETVTTGNLLQQLDIELSEPMLFGLGEGLGFIYWKMKMMDFPFIGGRVKTDALTQNICRNLNLNLAVSETSSLKKAWKNVADALGEGKAVGLKLDSYYLEYFSIKFHFAGHYATLFGYDDTHAYMVDTSPNGGKVKTSLESLAKARSERGPMSSKNLSYTISGELDPAILTKVIPEAIKRNATEFLNPPIKNLYYKGILKTSIEIKKWFARSKDVKGDFQTTHMLMEVAGTGGSIFRNLYRDFLGESAELLGSKVLEQGANNYTDIALNWKQVAELFYEAGETQQIKYINQASDILVHLSDKEKTAMEHLLNGL